VGVGHQSGWPPVSCSSGREAGHPDATCKEAVEGFVANNPQKSVNHCSELTVLEMARYTVQSAHGGGTAPRTPQEGRACNAAAHSGESHSEPGRRAAFQGRKPLLTAVSDKTRRDVLTAMEGYCDTLSLERRHFLERYQTVDVAFKVVGTGSVGTRDYVILGFGNGSEDALFLQMKEEPPSVYAQYLKAQIPRNQGGARSCRDSG